MLVERDLMQTILLTRFVALLQWNPSWHCACARSVHMGLSWFQRLLVAPCIANPVLFSLCTNTVGYYTTLPKKTIYSNIPSYSTSYYLYVCFTPPLMHLLLLRMPISILVVAFLASRIFTFMIAVCFLASVEQQASLEHFLAHLHETNVACHYL